METKVATGIVALITLAALAFASKMLDLMHHFTHLWYKTGSILHFVLPFALFIVTCAVGMGVCWLWDELFRFYREISARDLKRAQRRNIIKQLS